MNNSIDDNSLFQGIKIPITYRYIKEIEIWFDGFPPAKNRYIHFVDDVNSDDSSGLYALTTAKTNIDHRKALNPNYKYIGVVMNPWARMVLMFETLKNFTAQQKLSFPSFDQINLSNLEAFISQISLLPKDDSWPVWWWFTTNQSDWLIGTHTTDYILKAETLESDFAPFKNYFQNEQPVLPVDSLYAVPEYHSRYTENSATIVETLYQKDIKNFGYSY
jgi:hypothetical protein